MTGRSGTPETGLSRARSRLLRRLAERKARPREGLVMVEGPRALAATLAAGARLRFVVVARDRAPDDALLERLEHAGVEVVRLDAGEVAAHADTESPQGLLGVAEEPRPELPRRAGRERVLVLDAVQDPGNVGTLVRAAAAFGAHRILALDGTVDPWNPKAVRASAGLVFRLPLHRIEGEEAFKWLRTVELPLLVADARGRDVRAGGMPAHAEGGAALLVGNEGRGPRPAARAAAAAVVALPLAPGVESLNVAMAGAVLLWALGPGATSPPSEPE